MRRGAAVRWAVMCAALAGCVGAPSDGEDTGGGDIPDPPATDLPDETGDCADADGDGASCSDCDDADPDVYPGAVERCNGADDDCDGEAPGEGPLGVDCASCSLGGFWPVVEELSGAALFGALRERTEAFTACTYADARFWMLTELDRDPVSGQVQGVYTGDLVAVSATSEPDANVMNTEHTWPGSLGGREGIKECDLHHLFPTMADANNRRGNYPLALVAGGVTWERGGSRLGEDAAGNTVFEPRDVHKGDAARALLYMATRHPSLTLTSAEISRYRAWDIADPPDEAEIARSVLIGARQGAANPYVVCADALRRVEFPTE